MSCASLWSIIERWPGRVARCVCAMCAQGQREAHCCVTLAGSCRALAATNDVRASRKWIPLTPLPLLLFSLLSVCICLSPRLNKHSLIMLPIERASDLNELPVDHRRSAVAALPAQLHIHSSAVHMPPPPKVIVLVLHNRHYLQESAMPQVK